MSDKPKTEKKRAAKSEKGREKGPKKAASGKAVTARETSVKTTKPKTAGVTAPRKTKAAVEKPKTATRKQPTDTEAEARTTAARKKGKARAARAARGIKTELRPHAREGIVDSRLFRIAQKKKHHLPEFRRENAHRWIRLSDSWRNVRGNDSYTRQKRKGRIAMVSAGYRTPKLIRDIHPSMHLEVPVHNVEQLKGLDPKIHAVRIGGTVGARKRQEILKKAETMLLRVLNPGVPESVREEELFSELDTEAEKK